MKTFRLLAAAAIGVLASSFGATAGATPTTSTPAVQPEQGTGAIRSIGGPIRSAAKSIEELRAEAEAGDREAQADLGTRLLSFNDHAQAVEARRWLRRAADAGSAEAKNSLATALLMGLGGAVDAAEGRRLQEEAAREGSVGANLSLGERYVRGVEGYPRDPARGFAHIQTAARSNQPGSDFAQWRLAMMHLEGIGTPRNSEEAYRILVASSEAGGVRAMISRAVMLATGDGVAKDPVAARHWYQKAAESGQHGFEHGLRGLGAMMAVGEGGAVELARGVAYLRIASAAGDQTASRVLDMLASAITPQIDDEAKRLAGEWMQRHLPQR